MELAYVHGVFCSEFMKLNLGGAGVLFTPCIFGYFPSRKNKPNLRRRGQRGAQAREQARGAQGPRDPEQARRGEGKEGKGGGKGGGQGGKRS